MTKVVKLLKKWKSYIPPEVSKENVELVVKYFFPQSKVATGSGSHEIIVFSEIVEEFIEKLLTEYRWEEIEGYIVPFDRLGQFCIPCKGGRKVKVIYVRKLLEAIEKQDEIKKRMKGEKK